MLDDLIEPEPLTYEEAARIYNLHQQPAMHPAANEAAT